MAKSTSMKHKNKTKLILIAFLSFLVIAAGGFLFAYTRYLDYLKPGSTNSNEVRYVIEEGMSGAEIIHRLYEDGFIQSELATKIYMKLNKTPGFLAGKFTLRKNMSVEEILKVLTTEKNAIIEEVNITIIPGDWAKDAARRIAEATGLKEEEIMNKWNDAAYIDSLIEKYEFLTDKVYYSEHCYLEGYLAPETYRVYADATIEDITEKILDETKRICDEYRDDIASSGFNMHQIMTLASIIQFEAKTAEDMKWVSSVFYNRFDEGMKMESSVTVCYALYDKYKSWEDCEKDYPEYKYNTYYISGLPVGPICNPNEDAINAALNPNKSNYKYFMADVKTGDMYFAESYDEHLRNVEKYLN